MAATDRAAEAMEMAVLNSTHGENYVLEQGRLAHLEGRLTGREAITHRIIAESGAGQTRSQQPAGQGGVPS